MLVSTIQQHKSVITLSVYPLPYQPPSPITEVFLFSFSNKINFTSRLRSFSWTVVQCWVASFWPLRFSHPFTWLNQLLFLIPDNISSPASSPKPSSQSSWLSYLVEMSCKLKFRPSYWLHNYASLIFWSLLNPKYLILLLTLARIQYVGRIQSKWKLKERKNAFSW